MSLLAQLREAEINRLRSLHGVYESALYDVIASMHGDIDDPDLRHKAILDEMGDRLGRAAVRVEGGVPVSA